MNKYIKPWNKWKLLNVRKNAKIIIKKILIRLIKFKDNSFKKNKIISSINCLKNICRIKGN